ncbi:MAG: hypothetical protein DBW83_01525 [Synechococcus sp. MED-G69]|nr:MAG: hypothetical protein DBW83_01525 [Synechococcus sp. MED-G69]
MAGGKPVPAFLAKTVFTLTCRSCGTPVEIPGRFGFKLKGSGINSTLCSRCRQLQFQEARANDLASVDEQHSDGHLGQSTPRRLLPTAALAVALLLVIGSIWLGRRSSDQEPRPQDAASAVIPLPSR